MSGGVDSSVSAALLKKQGYDVVAIFLKLTPGTDKRDPTQENRCCTTESELRARKTAAMLGIPFYALNAEKAFKKDVVDCFLRDTKAGFTPNPCVDCNKRIKFGFLLDKAAALGCDFVATGHYAQLKPGKNGILKLFKGKDKSKDQSYFLWRLGQTQLRRTIFPVGGLLKTEVRALAKKFRLPAADTPESQEICFVPGSIGEFFDGCFGQRKGRIRDTAGRVIGEHSGLWHYTIGQRKGIKLAGGPYYVAAKNVKSNTLVVTKDKKDLLQGRVFLKSVNWIGGIVPQTPKKISVRIRYRAKEFNAVIAKNGRYVLKFVRPQIAPAAGQSAVFYAGRQLIGGGIITH